MRARRGKLGLAETQQTLLVNGLRGRVRVRVDGGFKTGRDVVIAALLGADEYSFGTAALVAAGCKMARQCHNNTCPVGIATQREDLRRKFPGKPEMVMAFLIHVAEEVREILARLGATSLDEIIGHAELLQQTVVGADAGHMDLSTAALDTGHRVRPAQRRGPQPAAPGVALGRPADGRCAGWFGLGERASHLALHHPQHRPHSGRQAIGRAGSGVRECGVCRTNPSASNLTGTAGQSFGAFTIHGIRLDLTGQANDYVGKGLAGGANHHPAAGRGEVTSGTTT